MRLFQLSEELDDAIAAMDAAVDEETGEIPEDDVVCFEKLSGLVDDKMKDWTRWFKNLRTESEGLRIESSKLAHRARVAENQMERIKGVLQSVLGEGADLEDAFVGRVLKDSTMRLSWRKRTGVETNDDVPPEDAPAEWVKTKRSWRRAELGDYLKGATDMQRADAAKYATLRTGKGLSIS